MKIGTRALLLQKVLRHGATSIHPLMGDVFTERIKVLLNARKLPWTIISVGIFIRLVQYISNRSLWQDESMLALNIVERSFSELLLPLDYDQGAPIGFLLAEKALFIIFGNNEYSLRFLPMLSGAISLIVFYILAKKFMRPQAVLVAVALFAVSGHLIYYSSEVKQYSTDVMIALLLFWITVYIQSKELLTRRVVLLLGLSGGIAIWFSHPSIFVLAGGALSLTYSGVGRREWGSFRRFCPAYLIWAISFMILYAFSLRILINQEGLLGYWAGGFMPFPPVSKSDIKWYWDTFIHLFSEPVVMRFPGIAALAFLVGCGSLFMKRRDKFYLFFSPIIAALLASSMHKYPFNGRLILFLVPSLFIFMAEGIAKIMVSTRTTSKMLGIALIALLFADPMMNAAGRIVKPYTREEIRAVLDYVARQQKQEDLFYLYHYSIHAFRYYSDRYSFKSSHIRFGISSLRDWNQYVKDLNSLRGNKRVWILFSHVLPPTWKGIGVDEEKFFIYHLDNIGKKLDSFKSEGAAAYLYDLSEKKAKLPFR